MDREYINYLRREYINGYEEPMDYEQWLEIENEYKYEHI